MNALLQQLRTHAERASPQVRVAAKLRIGRVEAAVDSAMGRITLEMALEEIGALPRAERGLLLDHATLFAAAIAPALLRDIPAESLERSGRSGHSACLLGKTMLQHGQGEAALQFVLQERLAEAFPFLFAMDILHELKDREQQQAVVRQAFSAWKETHKREFLKLLRTHWRVLPDGEAKSVLHLIVRWALNEPEWPLQASFDEGRLLFTSGREFTLFEILHIVRRLDPPLAEQLSRAHEQLAVAARRYPKGWESIQNEAEDMQNRQELEGGPVHNVVGYLGSGASRDMAYQFALRNGDFHRAMDHARAIYREDTDPETPNMAPKVLWPSAASFRSVLYHAGRRLGFDGRGLQKQIPDPDLRLLAGIEFVAALAGLPEMPNSSLRQSRAHQGRL